MPTSLFPQASLGGGRGPPGRHNPEVGIRGGTAYPGGPFAGRQTRRSRTRRPALSLPVGYVRDADGGTVIDPDQEVAAAVADVFAAFQATGSAYGVVGAFTNRRFPRRAYGGAWAGEVHWGRLTHSRAVGV